MEFVSLIVKATRLCNLRCTYCHDWRAGRDQTMPFSVLAGMTAAALTEPSHRLVEFIWHGGETTILPISFYEKAVLLQSRFRSTGQVVQNTIQTNGTRLTPEWVRFFRANQFSVGVSLDGPPEVHDEYRRYANGRASFADVAEGVRLLQQAEVPFTVLMVIDHGALTLGADRIFDFFLQYGIKSFGFLGAKPTNRPDATPGTPAEHYVPPAEMNLFLAQMYDRWLQHGDTTIHIRDLDAIHARLRASEQGMCVLAGGCFGKYFLIEPNGDVAHCDLFVGDDRYSFGNVLRDGFAGIRSHSNVAALRRENDRELDLMSDCPEFPICSGWCPHERYIALRHDTTYRTDCCGLRDLITHIRLRSSGGAVAGERAGPT
jgi:uncharacterized protein